ncbi:MAG: polysaccharide biosynthesis protein [Clostridia bacterium]|nr:polysaccharide biosynthesis protein [Clostridia bacterium]
MSRPKRNNFLTGALIIAAAHIITKIIGALFKIPLDRFILQAQGMGIYNATYNIYNWLFIVSTAGIPVAISKMVAESVAHNNYKEARRIFKVSLGTMLCIGLLAATVLFFGAGGFSSMIAMPRTRLSMMVMAPSLLFACLMSSFRGYFQGLQNMMPTALSEVVESSFKLIAGLALSSLLLPMGLEYASAGAIGGVSIGGGFALLFLLCAFFFYKNRTPDSAEDNLTPASRRQILKRLLKLALPITLGASVFSLTTVIDTTMVSNLLKGLGFSVEVRESLFGYLSRATTMFNLPPTIIAAIAISIVPAIATQNELHQTEQMHRQIKTSLRLTLLFSLPCAFGLSCLAGPILSLIYNDGNHAELLTILGLSVATVTFVQVSNAILQALGKTWAPVKNMLIGGLVKIGINYLLVSQIDINISGAPIGTFCCYAVIVLLNIIDIKRITPIRFGCWNFVFKPLIATLLMSVVAFFVQKVTFAALGLTLSVGIAIFCAAVTYVILLFMTRALSEDELLLLPKGEKLAALCRKCKLI